MMMKIFLVCFLLCYVQSKDLNTINFIKSYIENERKPTDLIYNDLGWPKRDLVELAKALSLSSVRATSAFRDVRSAHLRTLFLFDLDTADVNILNNATKHFRSPYRWLVLSDIEDEDKRSFLWNLPLLLDSDFVLALRSKEVFTLSELYKTSPGGPTYSQTRGHYNGTYVDTRVRREMYRRRGDVMGHEMVMSNVIQDNNSTQYHLPREDRLQLHYDALTKMNWVIGRMCFEMVNATPKYVFSHSYGYKSNGVWVGAINDVKNGIAVLSSNCIMTVDRLDPITFTDSVTQSEVRFIFRQPPLSRVSNIFTLPFSVSLWWAIIVCIFISVLALLLAYKWEAFRKNDTRLYRKFSDAAFLSISALSQQGCSVEMEPRMISGRIMLWVIFVTLMAVYVAYNAYVTVLIQAPSTAIRSLDQLAASMELAALDVFYNRYVFKGYTDPVRKEIYKRITPEKGKQSFCSLETCVERMRQGSFAFHALSEPVYRRVEETFLETEKCDLKGISFMPNFAPHLPVDKHSPYLELLRVNFKRIRESGIQSALVKRYIVLKPKCTGKTTAFVSIGIENVRPVLLLVLIGVAASVLILLLEIIVHRLSARHRDKRFVAKIRRQY